MAETRLDSLYAPLVYFLETCCVLAVFGLGAWDVAGGRLLSGGQRQRISIARAFLRDAPVLILDEPTTGLDAASTDRLLAVIRRFAADHTAIVITHDPRVTGAADDVLRLASTPPASTSPDRPVRGLCVRGDAPYPEHEGG